MTCEECGGERFEFAGVSGGAVRLRCTRCARVVEQALDPRARPTAAPASQT